MEKLPRRVYTADFRRQAVEMITRDGLGIAEASRRLAISPKTLTNWARRAKGGHSLAADAAPRRAATEEQAELSRLRRERTPSCGWSAIS
jgi:transposase